LSNTLGLHFVLSVNDQVRTRHLCCYTCEYFL
jgi:hypothetical protein